MKAMGWILLFALAASAQAADPQRQHEVAQRGSMVMPFDLNATTHVFTQTAEGGVQQVLAKDPADARQIALIRAHLQDIARRFAARDFSAPKAIHGDAMPGLATLEKAAPGDLSIIYSELPAGAQIRYSTASPAVRDALHAWFNAQLGDHGSHAMAGHVH